MYILTPPEIIIVRDVLVKGKDYIADKISFGRNGFITVKKDYYYRHGKSADQLANKISKWFPQAKTEETYDDYKSSCFVVKFFFEEAIF